MLFNRKIYSELQAFKDGYGGKRALMIEGARRVGKTTVIKEFVKNEYRSYILIDFSYPSKNILRLFEDFNGLDDFFLELQRLTGTVLHDRNSAIVFDEVQLYPPARQLIKHLVADGRYDYYETGSLISIRRNVRDILIPSEERSIEMHPMDFEEFLWALGDEMTMPFIRRHFEERKALGGSHDSVMRTFRKYMLVGGMPQAVSAFIEENSYRAVEEAKRDIISLYENDAEKIGRNAGSILRSIPSELSRHDKSFKPSDFRKNSSTRDYINAVHELAESKMVLKCTCCTDPSVAQDLFLDENTFKLYLNDTGLLFTMAFSRNKGLEERTYSEILANRLGINQGMFFENIVAQSLVAAGYGLAYCKFKSNESERLQEIDFLLSEDGGLKAIEAKSGYSHKHTSLDRFIRKYGERIRESFVVHGGDLETDGDVTYIPVYMCGLLRHGPDKSYIRPLDSIGHGNQHGGLRLRILRKALHPDRLRRIPVRLPRMHGEGLPRPRRARRAHEREDGGQAYHPEGSGGDGRGVQPRVRKEPISAIPLRNVGISPTRCLSGVP